MKGELASARSPALAGRRGGAEVRLRLARAVYRAPRLWRSVRFFGSFALLLLLWLLAAQLIDPIYVPSPSDTLAAFGELMAKGILPAYVVDSMRHLMVAGVLGIAVGIPLGLLIGVNRLAAAFCYPLLNFFQSLSGIAWLPMIVIWFGFSDNAIVAAILYAVIFPVAFNTLVGVRTVPRVYANAVRTLGGSQWRVTRDVLVPGALPNIITGMRLGIAYGWRALIAAEIVISANGLGFLLRDAQNLGITSRIVLGMLVIGSLWLLLDQWLLRPIEQATIQRWGLVRR